MTAFDEILGLKVRKHNAYDRSVVTGVIEGNRYRLPEHFGPGDVILDVGAHVGSFTATCMMRGAGQVYAFEPDAENARLFRRNTARYEKRVWLEEVAVWRSDISDEQLLYTGPTEGPEGTNFAGGNVLFGDGSRMPVRCRALDSILSNIRRVRLLKLDCEGSEWPILFTCRQLSCIEEIVGEYHEIGGRSSASRIPEGARVDRYTSYTADDLASHLTREGFKVSIIPFENTNLGLFFANRNTL